MITTLKLAGISAILSAGLVTGFSAHDERTAPAASGKLFYDRVSEGPSSAPLFLASAQSTPASMSVNSAAKSDRLQTRDEVRCTRRGSDPAQADCVPDFEAPASATREVRISEAVSALVREGSPRALAIR